MSDITEFPEKPNELPAEDRFAARAAMKARKAFAATFSPFVKAMREAMTGYLAMRKQGVSREDGIKGIEHVLRETWPKRPTKFPVCEDCDGTGWAEQICRPYVRCQRETCADRGEEWQHRYVVVCSCPKGDRFRPRPVDDEFAAVGKSQKPKRGFSRIGS